MQTRVKKIKNTSKNNRKPLSDKTNDVNTSKMKRKSDNKKTDKQSTLAKTKINNRRNKNVVATNTKPEIKETKNDSTSNNNTQIESVTRRRSTRLSNKQTETSTLKNEHDQNKKRIIDTYKNVTSDNNSDDPYEFKFDPKDEPKKKSKKQKRNKKCNNSLYTSNEEDNSMKLIIKNIRKKVNNKQKIHVTPRERKLRNRLIKVDDQAGLVPKKQNQKEKNVVVSKNDKIIPNEICENSSVLNEINPINTSIISEKNPTELIEKNTSVLDEINEIANTFLEDDNDDLYQDNSDFMSTPSRINIISNLIARKNTKTSTNVFNSTMINETTKKLTPPSPWRMEMSFSSKKKLNSTTKHKSCTPSNYVNKTSINNKKQSNLLGFVNRQTNIDLFQNSSSRLPFENLSNSISPIRNVSPAKKNDSLFGFTVLSSSENKENSPVFKRKLSPKSTTKFARNKITSPKSVTKYPENKIKSPEFAENLIEISEKNTEISIDKNVVKHLSFENNQFVDNSRLVDANDSIDISIPLFEDLNEVKVNKKRYSRQYTRPQIKRKRNVSFTNDSDVDSEPETEIHVKKKQKDVLTEKEAEEIDKLASFYNSYFEEVEHFPLCIE